MLTYFRIDPKNHNDKLFLVEWLGVSEFQYIHDSPYITILAAWHHRTSCSYTPVFRAVVQAHDENHALDSIAMVFPGQLRKVIQQITEPTNIERDIELDHWECQRCFTCL
jgi:hypothetical protein